MNLVYQSDQVVNMLANNLIRDLYTGVWRLETEKAATYMSYDEFCNRALVTYARGTSGRSNDWRLFILAPERDRLGPFIPATPELRLRLYGSQTKDYSEKTCLQSILSPLNALRLKLFDGKLKV